MAEELEDRAKEERRLLHRMLREVVILMLKGQFRLQETDGSWRGQLLNLRFEIENHLEDSPSLRETLRQNWLKEYGRARELVRLEFTMAPDALPTAPPFSFDDALTDHFFPEPPE